MNRSLDALIVVIAIVTLAGALPGCALFERDASLSRFRTACVGLYDTVGLLAALRRGGHMTDDEWTVVNGFVEDGDQACQDPEIENFSAALSQVQDARAGIAKALKRDDTNV